jgi:hypothetical protein
VAVDLSHYVEDIARAVRDPRILRVAAEAMSGEMKRATARYIGADLKMSNFRGGPAEFITETKNGEATLIMRGGTYALADTGRRQKKRAFARRGSALNTPWGPKSSVAGSRWSGFGITENHGPDALDMGIRAVVAEVERGFS